MAKVKFINATPSPKKKIAVINASVQKQTQDVLNRHSRLRADIVRPFSPRNKARFPNEQKPTRTGLKMRVWITGRFAESAKKRVYQLLNDGTRIRKVILTDGYVRGTNPNQLATFAKRGGVIRNKKGYVVINKRAKYGIKERNWEEIINFMLEKPMDDAITKGVKDGLKSLEY